MVKYHCFVLFAVLYTATALEFQLQSNFGWTLWIGIKGNPNHPDLENGGIELQPGERRSINAPDNWEGRFWARTGCNRDNNWCETGNCGGNGPQCQGTTGEPPCTLAEITKDPNTGLDWYDISLVDGSNIPMAFEPLGGQGDGSPNSCKRLACNHDFNTDCPEDLKLYREGRVVGCKSACVAFDKDEYCCRGDHDKPETCKSSDWPVNYPEYFKSRCPDAYSYAYDDKKSLVTCRAPAYLITFG